jgi:hypothetical protein
VEILSAYAPSLVNLARDIPTVLTLHGNILIAFQQIGEG